MFGALTKEINKTVGVMLTQNKGQSALLSNALKAVSGIAAPSGGGPMKALLGDLSKTLKLVEAQTDLLGGIDLPEPDKGAKDDAKVLKELQDTLKQVMDENRKQTRDIEDMSKEIEDAAKDAGGDRDAAKKVKVATDAIEKARKLIDEQSKLLEEARKALAD